MADSPFEAKLQMIRNNHPDLSVVAFQVDEDAGLSDSLTESQIGELCQALATNTEVTWVNFYNFEITEGGARYLSAMLKANTSISKLQFIENGLDDQKTLILIEGLKFHPAIAELEFSGNTMGLPAILALSKIIATNWEYPHALTHLTIRDNRLSDAAVKILAQAVEDNSTIEELILENVNMSNVGAEYVARMLKTNSTLKTVSLEKNNNIGDVGVTAMAQALKFNTSLEYLGLYYVSMTKEGGQALLDALDENTTLLYLDFTGRVGKDIERSITRRLETNRDNQRIRESLFFGMLFKRIASQV